jgi:hypothetical protein
VQIAREVNLNTLFTSAFLSELIAENEIKASQMKIGSSPMYLIKGQEPQLEKFAHHLKSKEKEAYLLLKEKGFLRDTEQEPAIRVALRSIRDFAVPFKKQDTIYWKYYTTSESEMTPETKEIVKESQKEQTEEAPKQKEKFLNIFKKPQPKKKSSRKATSNKGEKFFNKVKESLAKKSIEIIGIESMGKTDLGLRVRKQDKEYFLAAYNKKRISEADILKAFKKASELSLNYIILSLGEPLKKITNLVEAVKDLNQIDKID